MIRRRRFTWFTACVCAIIMSGSAILAGAAGTASASPDVICCGEFFYNVSEWQNATNVTINYTASFSNLTPFTVYFGNTSSGEIYSQPATYSNTTLQGHVFLDYLQPDTTYNFELFIASTCIHGQVEYYCTYSSSFNTSVDRSTTFSGVVSLAGGGHAPSGVPVLLYCPSIGELGGEAGYTNSQGAYSINWGSPYAGDCSGEPLVATALGQPYSMGGYWNETVVVWAPQGIDFTLPKNFIGPFIPEVLDFSNATSGYSSISFISSFSTSTTLTDTWSVNGGGSVGGVGGGGGEGGSSSITYSNTSGSGPFSNGGTLDYGAEWNTSGTLQSNAIYRAWNITSENAYGKAYKDGNAVSGFGLSPPSSWLTPANVGKSDTYYVLNKDGLPMEAVSESNGSGYEWNVETSTTKTYSTDYSLSFSLGATIPLPGAPSFSFTGSLGWSQTSSTTSSTDLQFKIGGGTTAECYDVIGQGGSQSSGTADMIGIVMYNPSGVLPDGHVECSSSGL